MVFGDGDFGGEVIIAGPSGCPIRDTVEFASPFSLSCEDTVRR